MIEGGSRVLCYPCYFLNASFAIFIKLNLLNIENDLMVCSQLKCLIVISTNKTFLKVVLITSNNLFRKKKSVTLIFFSYRIYSQSHVVKISFWTRRAFLRKPFRSVSHSRLTRHMLVTCKARSQHLT